MVIESHNAKNWLELVGAINYHFADWPDYIFRGHANKNWLLEPTLSRVLKTIEYKDKNEMLEEHLERFKKEITGRRGVNPKDLDENEYWALGQHYGLYTPLLDWTRSPWIAVFFAIINSSEKSDNAIWALHIHDIERINSWYRNNNNDSPKFIVELIEPTLDENSRLINQRGLFTKIHFDNDIESWVKNCTLDIEWVTLFKITFPNSVRDTALSFLNLMNINFSSIYPDLEGSSLQTNSRLIQTDYYATRQEQAWLKHKNINEQ